MKNLRTILITTLAVASTSLAFASPVVEMKTNLGTVVIELNEKAAPKHVENFVNYVNSGFYEGTVFHRVIKGFMVQGGGFSKDMKQKPTKAGVTHERDANMAAGVKNDRGTLAMARTGDPHSGTAQFFINTVNNDFLNPPGRDGWGYTVFGKVTSGMDVIDKIAEMPVDPNGNVPKTQIIIEKVTVKK